MFSLLHITHTINIAQAAAFLLCLLTLRPLIQLGIMDRPVQRSAHNKPTPKGGGIAIIVAFLAGLLLHASLTQQSLSYPQLSIASATLFLCVVSWIDDVRPFSARYKLLAQALATSLIVIGYGFPLISFIPLLMLGLICTNTINFMDGLNGLAAGALILSAIIMAGFGITPTVLLLLASSLLGFLPFNFPKARIFMGDAGSQPCALIFSWAWMSLAPLPEHITKPSALFWLPLCVLAGFFWDVAFTLGRRFCCGDPLATAHRSHLYQLAIRTHISAPSITLCHWLFVIWGGRGFFSIPWSSLRHRYRNAATHLDRVYSKKSTHPP